MNAKNDLTKNVNKAKEGWRRSNIKAAFDQGFVPGVLGLGVNIASNLPFADVLRIEGNFVEFDEVSITTTNTNGTADTHTKKGEAELMTISLSIAKSF